MLEGAETTELQRLAPPKEHRLLEQAPVQDLAQVSVWLHA